MGCLKMRKDERVYSGHVLVGECLEIPRRLLNFQVQMYSTGLLLLCAVA